MEHRAVDAGIKIHGRSRSEFDTTLVSIGCFLVLVLELIQLCQNIVEPRAVHFPFLVWDSEFDKRDCFVILFTFEQYIGLGHGILGSMFTVKCIHIHFFYHILSFVLPPHLRIRACYPQLAASNDVWIGLVVVNDVRKSTEFLRLTNKYFALLPDADRVVRALAQKYPLTIVSNGFREVQYYKFAHSGLQSCFTHLIVSDEIGINKPQPGIFQIALEKNGVTADEAIMIGDSYLATPFVYE